MATTGSRSDSPLSRSIYRKHKSNSKSLLQSVTPTPESRALPSAMLLEKLPEYVKTSAQLLASIGFASVNATVYNQLRSLYPVISVVDSVNEPSSLENNERHLANHYKCDVYHHGCYYTTSDEANFISHIEKKHPNQALYCFYCTKVFHQHEKNCSNGSLSHSTFLQPDDLIKHINNEHSDLKFQCNLCYYRAFSLDHIFIHQALEHLKYFEKSLKQTLVEKKNNDSEQSFSLIEKHFLQQLIDSHGDEDTEVEDDGNDENTENKDTKFEDKVVCRILDCRSTKNGDEEEIVVRYFNQYGYKLEYPNMDQISASLTHCAYCMVADDSSNGSNNSAHNEDKQNQIEDVWIHCVCQHPGYPILAYDLSFVKKSFDIVKNTSDNTVIDIKSKMKKLAQSFSNEPKNYDLNKVDENVIENIISTFRQQLANITLPPSYDSILMKNAFDYFESQSDDKRVGSTTLDVDKVAVIKGVKRRHSDETSASSSMDDEENDETRSEELKLEQPNQVPLEPTVKRRRLLHNLSLPQAVLRRTRTLASMAATAAMALGFYHLTRFLPESMQNYINQN